MGRASPERIRVVLHQLDVKPAVGVRRVHGLIQRAKRIVIDGPVAEIADRVAPLHCLDDVHTYSPYTGLRCRSTPSIMKTMTGRDEDGGFNPTYSIQYPSHGAGLRASCRPSFARIPGPGAARGHPPATPGAGYAGRTTMEGGTIMIRRYRVSNGSAAGGSGGNGRDDGRKASRAVGRAVAAAMGW